MLKTISAALLAVSVLAAPAMAAGVAKNTTAPVIKSVPVKTIQAKPGVLNANARMGRHHHRHFRHHHRFHKRMGVLRSHYLSKAGFAHGKRA